MKIKKLLRLGAVVVTAIGLSAPALVSASTGSIDTTGPDSRNTVRVRNRNHNRVRNNNNVSASLSTGQTSTTGDVTARRNTTVGDAASGIAENDSSVGVTASVDNSSASEGAGATELPDDDGTISDTGPDSVNRIEFNSSSDTRITNTNNVSVSNTVSQSATSGDVNVSRNTTGGDATSGDASNTSTVEVELNVTN